MTSSTSRNQSAEGASGYLTIDLMALRDNYLLLVDKAPNRITAAVVKADAYGLGAETISPVLYQAGCRHYFVAHINEAISLRNILPSDTEIYLLNGLQPSNQDICVSKNITPVANSLEQLVLWNTKAKSMSEKLDVIIQIDTGMARLGFSIDDIQHLNHSDFDRLNIKFIMSHLACADEYDSTHNTHKLHNFIAMSSAFPDVQKCFANSAGVLLGDEFIHSMIRPGIALYGGAPSGSITNPMKPVVKLEIAVIQTRTVPSGTAVGYGASFVAPAEMRLATIAAGYADGLPRSLSNKGAFYYQGTRLPIIGRVSMDSIIIDISELPTNTLKLGDLVEAIGTYQTLEDLAEDAGTISYEILTSLGSRYHRNYIYPDDFSAPEILMKKNR